MGHLYEQMEFNQMAAQLNRMDVAERWRTKISQSNIFAELLKFCEGKLAMEPHRAAACLKLVGKFLPDLQAATLDININHQSMDKLELEARAHVLGINPNELWHSIDNQSVIEHDKVIVIQEDTSESE